MSNPNPKSMNISKKSSIIQWSWYTNGSSHPFFGFFYFSFQKVGNFDNNKTKTLYTNKKRTSNFQGNLNLRREAWPTHLPWCAWRPYLQWHQLQWEKMVPLRHYHRYPFNKIRPLASWMQQHSPCSLNQQLRASRSLCFRSFFFPCFPATTWGSASNPRNHCGAYYCSTFSPIEFEFLVMRV